MITKEEAVNIFDIDDGFTNGDSIAIVYDEIVKSIGSCGECLYGTPLDDKSYIYCTRITNYADECNDASWFCADFSRR